MSTRYKREYERMIKRLKSKRGKLFYSLRMHTVELVFGSLQQHYGLRWMNVRGRNSASKVMLMAAAAFNLKKWLKNSLNNAYLGANNLILVLRAFIVPFTKYLSNFQLQHSLSFYGDSQRFGWV